MSNYLCKLRIADCFTGATPREILTQFRLNDPDCLLTDQDIYNLKKKLRKNRLDVYTSTQALLRALHRDRWFVKVDLRKKTKEVKKLFFIHKSMLEILCKNPEVLIMDCTYKTNKYHMPLLTICGVTVLGTTFIVGFAFIEKENKNYYDWILYHLKQLYASLGLTCSRVIATDRDLALMEAIDHRFPAFATTYNEGTRQVLCLWHLHRNVAKNCKASFPTDEEWEAFLTAWHIVIYAITYDAYLAVWTELVTTYYEHHREDIDYLCSIWLEPWKDRLCKYHTNEIRHYGTTTTSRAEDIHRVLKSNLKFSTGDLMTVIDRIEMMLINQLKKHRKDLGKTKRSTPFDFRHIWKIHDQFKRLKSATKKNSLPPCTEAFTKTMGLPCSHLIEARIDAVDGGLGRILLSDVDTHWWFKKPDSGIIPTADFVSDHPAINEALAEPLEAVEDVLDIDLNSDQPLPSIDDIIRDLQASNRVQRPPPDSPEAAAKLIDDDIDLLDVNEPRIVKTKGRSVEAKNRKSTMTRAEKAKTKSTKRDLSGFEHIDAIIKVSRGGKRNVDRGGRGKARSKKQKKPEDNSVAAMDADIQPFNKEMDEIHKDIKRIITRQTARKTTEGVTEASAASIAIRATAKEIIQVSDDGEFDADGGGNADSNNNWMYDRGD